MTQLQAQQAALVALARRSDSAVFHAGSQVWVPIETVAGLAPDGSKKKQRTWQRGVVEVVHQQPTGELLLDVRTEQGQQLEGLPAADCCLQNERDDTVDDLVKSDFLHEPGGSILIAANPHKRLRQLYGPRMMAQYRGVPLGELSPHVYAIAEQAYAAMMMDEARQAILISGESGAGKTESAKMVMQYLAHRAMPAHAQHARLEGGGGSGGIPRTGSGAPGAGGKAHANGGLESAPIEEQVLESNPLLEAFGNAKTSRNDNSSRFGKFVEIDFDAGGRVTGASISTYLLERSRVVSIKAPERSYHIFYQVCWLSNAAAFRYLRQSGVYELSDVDDAQEFRHTLEAMRIVGLQQHHVDAVLRTVAGVLHLGNAAFSDNNSDEAVVADGGSMAALETAARLLGVSDVGLEAALTTRAIETRGERIVKRLDCREAAESRDALAKTLYARLFDWLVAAINKKINSLGSGGGGANARRIGILDIYGFESFDINSFEQLCINLANERLQQQFNAHVFKGEQEEYAREGIAWSYIDFVDNQDCLDLLEGAAGASGLGVFPLIDEACRLPRATYQDLAHTLRSRLAGQPRFGAPKRAQHAFVVDHYAGGVCYTTEQLMEKNKDFVVAEHAHLLGGSTITIIRELFAADAAAAATGGAAADAIAAAAGSELPSPRKADGKIGGRNCVKPNPESRPGSLQPEYVLEQLRAGGVLEAVRIACAGFPTRKPFRPFAQRYALLLPEAPANARQRPTSPGGGSNGGLALPLTPTGFIDWFALSEPQLADVSRRILFASQLEGWQLGRSRVFLRAGQLAQLEGARGRRLAVSATKIQAAWRGMEARQLLRRARAAAVAIQSAWRGHVARKEAGRLRRERAATKLQATWRMHRQRSAFLLQRRTRAAVTIQSYVRMAQQRRRFIRDTELGKKQAARAAAEAARAAAAITIQAAVRRRLAEKKVAQLRREAARLRELTTQRDSLAEERQQLQSSLTAAVQRAERAEAEVATLRAQLASLSSELEASQLQLRTAQAAAAEAVTAASASAAVAAQAAAASELEAAHRKAAQALQAEIEVLRQQRAAGEAAQTALEGEVRELQAAVRGERSQVEALAAASQQKEAEHAAALEGLQAAAAEQRCESAAKDAALTALQAEAIASAAALHSETDQLRQQLASEVAALQAALAEQREQAAAAEEERAAERAAAQERSGHMQSRVAALSERSQRLEAELQAARGREAQLQEELQAAKRAASALQRTPSKIGAMSPGASRTLSNLEQMESPGTIPAVPAATGAAAGAAPAAGLSAQRAEAVETLKSAAVQRRLPVVPVPLGAAGTPLAIPLSSWLLCESLIRWAGAWQPGEIVTAADALQRAIVDAADGGGLRGQAYWLACSLAAGGLLKFRTVGRREYSHLLRLSDALINCTPVHEALGDSIADALPVSVAVLLSDEAKRVARRRGHAPVSPGPDESPGGGGGDAAQSPWRALLGGVSNVLEALRAEGVPAPAVRAVAWACLRFIDAELLNALLLRRDCCSVSAAKALQAGLAELRGWVAYVGGEWCCGPEEAEAAIERVTQAARFLVQRHMPAYLHPAWPNPSIAHLLFHCQGKDDCIRKAYRGVDIVADLARSCPALSLQQVYRLSEHQHDDWLGSEGASGRESIGLLETLKRLMAEQQARMGGGGGGGEADGEEEDEEEDLLVEPREAFVLPWRVLTEAARCFVQPPAALLGGSTPARVGSLAPAAGTPSTPMVGGGSPLRPAALSAAPRLPNGSLPAAAAAASPAVQPAMSTLVLLDTIGQACLAADLPPELRGHPEFAFLAPDAEA
ncbi:hypothetical protein COHA_009277 [Chlorella ohadii]|uniref:Myosin-J heavy chain n=1 Tax=Chlorella ohadii TaxID=2649997 RepID=A0AAD5DFS6_9CHLO|nr:hypothetical protein COHA_009277 [Chlorella ohadii]